MKKEYPNQFINQLEVKVIKPSLTHHELLNSICKLISWNSPDDKV